MACNLIRTMFINKRICDKLGGRPPEVPISSIKKLGVVGAGMMGSGIAYAASVAGIDVLLLDTTQEKADKGRDHALRLVQKDIEKKRISQTGANYVLERIVPATSYALLAGCDLVIEAVFEERALKADVIRKVEAATSGTGIVASNTSTLPITGLAENTKHPDRFIGIHFFSPVERMSTVEIIKGRQTSSETLAKAMDFVAQLRKTPLVVNDSPGFYTSRIFCTYMDEGMAMLEEGVNPVLIENAARMSGMAKGPLAVTDEVSLDLQKKSHRSSDLGRIAGEVPAGACTTGSKHAQSDGTPWTQGRRRFP